jgi:N utilization substance protein B
MAKSNPQSREKEEKTNLKTPSGTASGGSRRNAREAALQALFLNEMNPQNSFERSLGIFLENFSIKELSRPFFLRLVQGVWEHQAEIDLLIQKHSENWRLERMSRVDCNILRIAVFELVHCPDVPPRAAINEAIDLGKHFSTEESGAFINGILDSIFITRYGKPSPEEIEE